MKKIFMTLAAVAVAATMNAQLYIGGSLGFQTRTTKTDVAGTNPVQTIDSKWSEFSILPEVGYNLNEKMAVGMQIGFTATDDKDANNTKSNAFTIAPYFRYTFVKWDKVSLFADAGINFRTGTTKVYSTDPTTGKEVSTDNNTNRFFIGVVPGIAFQASEKVSVVAKLGTGLGYTHEKVSDAVKFDQFGFDVNSLGLQLGAYYNF